MSPLMRYGLTRAFFLPFFSQVCNKRTFGDTNKLSLMIATLAAKSLPKGWPVSACSFSPCTVAQEADAAVKAPTDPAPVPPTPVISDTLPLWLHGSMDNGAAAALIPDGAEDGTFFIRERVEGSEYVVTVVFKSKPTHHLSKWDDGDGCYLINKKPLEGTKTVQDVVACLRTKHKFWPVPLTISINVDPAVAARKVRCLFARHASRGDAGACFHTRYTPTVA